MTAVLHLNDTTRPLFVEMCHHIARGVWETLGQGDPDHSARMWTAGEAVYERACDLLADLGVLSRVGPSHFAFLIPLSDVRAHLAGLAPRTRTSLTAITGIFLWLTCEELNELSTGRAPFEVPDDLLDVMQALVGTGKAVRDPDGFRWTSKIAPMMMTENLWEPDARRTAKQDKRTPREKLADEMWEALPLWRRHYLARRSTGRSGGQLMTHLYRCWDGERFLLREKTGWIFFPPDLHVTADILIARLRVLRDQHPF